MKHNFSNLDATHNPTVRNFESGSKVAAKMGRGSADKKSAGWSGRWSSLGADHAKRWEKRLYVAKSGGVELRKLAVRIQHLGRRQEFRFDTTNRAAAALQALGIFRFLKANGWEVTLAKFKPDADGPTKLDVTFGDYLAAVENTHKLRARTFDNYRRCLRTIIAEAFRVRPKKNESKYDYRNGGHEAWVKRTDGVRLDQLTPDRLNQWKRARVADVGHAPAAIAAARRTINSYIRCARSLFCPALVRELTGLKLPAPLPFTGVELEESGSQKYVSKINAQAIIASAHSDLRVADPEAYKAFLLGLFAGMRKAEIDSSEWKMLDFTNNVLHLQETQWLHLKTRDSAADISIDQEVMSELRALIPAPTDKPAPWSQFILQSPLAPRPDSLRPFYRAQETFDRLYTWLRGKGIVANKPLHELRKEVGAVIVTEQGIYAASKFLRHTDITTTARHYADHKERINVGLGKFLNTEPVLAKAANS